MLSICVFAILALLVRGEGFCPYNCRCDWVTKCEIQNCRSPLFFERTLEIHGILCEEHVRMMLQNPSIQYILNDQKCPEGVVKCK